jgi:spermidine synthase
MILSTWAAQVVLKGHLQPLYQNPLQLLGYLGVLTVPVLIPLSLVFPALLSQARTHDSRSSYIGLLYVFNSSGALLAGVVFGLWIDGLSLYDMIVMLALVCSMTWVFYATRGTNRVFVAVGAALCMYPGFRLLNAAIPSGWNNGVSVNAFHHIGSVTNGVTGQVSIGWYDAPENGGALLVNGQAMGSIPQEPINAKTVMLALSIVPQPRSVLQLGAGAASTARYFRDVNGTAPYTLVDWSHELASLMKAHRRAEILDLNRLDINLKTADANVFMNVEPGKYDVIFDALIHPHHVGANAVRNVRFFTKIERALEVSSGEPGIYVVGGLGAKFDRVGHTLKKVFRNVVYYPEVGVLVASNRSPEKWHRGSGADEGNTRNLYAKLGAAAKISYEEYVRALESGRPYADSSAQVGRPLDFSYEYNLSSWIHP